MKNLLTLLVSILLLSCNKEDTPKQIEGDWYYTRVIIHYNDGSSYNTIDHSWDNALYSNTSDRLFVGTTLMSYTQVDNNTIYISDVDRNADIEYLESSKDGFDLHVEGFGESNIEKFVYFYRRKK